MKKPYIIEFKHNEKSNKNVSISYSSVDKLDVEDITWEISGHFENVHHNFHTAYDIKQILLLVEKVVPYFIWEIKEGESGSYEETPTDYVMNGKKHFLWNVYNTTEEELLKLKREAEEEFKMLNAWYNYVKDVMDYRSYADNEEQMEIAEHYIHRALRAFDREKFEDENKIESREMKFDEYKAYVFCNFLDHIGK